MFVGKGKEKFVEMGSRNGRETDVLLDVDGRYWSSECFEKRNGVNRWKKNDGDEEFGIEGEKKKIYLALVYE